MSVVVAIVVFALVLAGGVGYFVYQHVLENAVKPEIQASNLSAVLVEPQSSTEPTWTLLVATDSSSAETGRGNVDKLSLVYVNSADATVSCIDVPSDMRVYVDGYGYKTVGETFNLGHEAALVSCLAKTAGVSITHYIEINQAGIEKLTPALGVEAPDNADEATLLSAYATRIFGSSSEQMKARGKTIVEYVASDMSSSAFVEWLQTMRGINPDTSFFVDSLPVTQANGGGSASSDIDTAGWATMKARLSRGVSPKPDASELSQYAALRSSNKVTIWNGVGVSGVAADCESRLASCGWQIESTGNAAQFVYSETLVIYKEDADEQAANLLVEDLGQGRVVLSAGRYAFDGTLLVVVGSNYQPS